MQITTSQMRRHTSHANTEAPFAILTHRPGALAGRDARDTSADLGRTVDGFLPARRGSLLYDNMPLHNITVGLKERAHELSRK